MPHNTHTHVASQSQPTSIPACLTYSHRHACHTIHTQHTHTHTHVASQLQPTSISIPACLTYSHRHACHTTHTQTNTGLHVRSYSALLQCPCQEESRKYNAHTCTLTHTHAHSLTHTHAQSLTHKHTHATHPSVRCCGFFEHGSTRRCSHQRGGHVCWRRLSWQERLCLCVCV